MKDRVFFGEPDGTYRYGGKSYTEKEVDIWHKLNPEKPCIIVAWVGTDDKTIFEQGTKPKNEEAD